MKHLYLLLCVVSMVAGGQSAAAQNWRPFRPNGAVHAFRLAATDTVLTMRLDSAAAQGPDSVYYFNRVMRRVRSNQWAKYWNNQFGQYMAYTPATRTYYLVHIGVPVPPPSGFSTTTSIALKPFARIGAVWSSAFSDVAVSTTLLSRGTSLVDGVLDSVVTFQIGNPPNTPATQVVLSKNHGLVSGPADFRYLAANARTLTLARRPAPAGQSYYNPLAMADYQPGDELGYETRPIMSSGIDCYNEKILRRILSRQQTADSLIYTFQQQSIRTQLNAPGCYSSPGTTTSAVVTLRLAASLRTGKWRGSPGSSHLTPREADLLAYEYRPGILLPAQSVIMGHPVVASRSSGNCGGWAPLRQQVLYSGSGTNSSTYYPGLDNLAWEQLLTGGNGVAQQYETTLQYFRLTIQGIVKTCGTRTDFGTLLPSRTAAAATFRLYPNPAATAVTLELAAPAGAGTRLMLLDMAGRPVWKAEVAAGKTQAQVPLAAQPAGLYLVRLEQPGSAPVVVRVLH